MKLELLVSQADLELLASQPEIREAAQSVTTWNEGLLKRGEQLQRILPSIFSIKYSTTICSSRGSALQGKIALLGHELKCREEK